MYRYLFRRSFGMEWGGGYCGEGGGQKRVNFALNCPLFIIK